MGPFAKDWDEAAITRDDPNELLYVPIMVGMNAPDFDNLWVQDVCVKLSGHPNFNVRANAMLGFGHIARTRRELDLVRVAPIISVALLVASNVRYHQTFMNIIRSKIFTAERAWGFIDIANMGCITTRLHWTDQPYKWHINDGEEVFTVLDG
jgi:hypothetical protein